MCVPRRVAALPRALWRLAVARAMRVLLRANTGPVDVLVYYLALCWLAFLALTPDASFVKVGLSTALAYKGVWVWPALLATLATPLGWMSDRAWLHRAARTYAVMWWMYIGFATLLVTTAVVIVWAPAFGCAVAATWLLAREGANDLQAAPEG